MNDEENLNSAQTDETPESSGGKRVIDSEEPRKEYKGKRVLPSDDFDDSDDGLDSDEEEEAASGKKGGTKRKGKWFARLQGATQDLGDQVTDLRDDMTDHFNDMASDPENESIPAKMIRRSDEIVSGIEEQQRESDKQASEEEARRAEREQKAEERRRMKGSRPKYVFYTMENAPSDSQKGTPIELENPTMIDKEGNVISPRGESKEAAVENAEKAAPEQKAQEPEARKQEAQEEKAGEPEPQERKAPEQKASEEKSEASQRQKEKPAEAAPSSENSGKAASAEEKSSGTEAGAASAKPAASPKKSDEEVWDEMFGSRSSEKRKARAAEAGKAEEKAAQPEESGAAEKDSTEKPEHVWEPLDAVRPTPVDTSKRRSSNTDAAEEKSGRKDRSSSRRSRKASENMADADRKKKEKEPKTGAEKAPAAQNAPTDSERRDATAKARNLQYWLFFIILGITAIVGILIPLHARSNENRELTSRPTLTVSGLLNGSYFTELDQWYDDTYPGRAGLSGFYNGIGVVFGFDNGSSSETEEAEEETVIEAPDVASEETEEAAEDTETAEESESADETEAAEASDSTEDTETEESTEEETTEEASTEDSTAEEESTEDDSSSV